jgi:glucose-6-phosphate isomerase
VAKKLSSYFDILKKASQDEEYKTHESLLYLANDAKLRQKVFKLAKVRNTKDLKEVMVVGIGGSNLGTLAVEDALRPIGVRLSYFDTAHVQTLQLAIARMRQVYKDGGKVLLNVISKSGTTNETVMNAKVLIRELQKLTDDWADDIVATTQPGSKLEDWALEYDIAILPNPEKVGGRYSVFCPVGIFPLALAGVDTRKLHKGASKMLEKCLDPDVETNPALQSVTAIWRAMKNQATIHNLFLFDQYLEKVGKWFRQLTAESLGKAGKGITPIVSVGSTDLHSTFQLYLSGPKDKFTTFVTAENGDDIPIPAIDSQFDEIVPELNKKTVEEVMDAIYEGTRQSYQNRELPYVEVVLEKINEEEIGAFLQFKMVETMLLAQLMDVNAFNQPNVEEYKVITRRLLGN